MYIKLSSSGIRYRNSDDVLSYGIVLAYTFYVWISYHKTCVKVTKRRLPDMYMIASYNTPFPVGRRSRGALSRSATSHWEERGESATGSTRSPWERAESAVGAPWSPWSPWSPSPPRLFWTCSKQSPWERRGRRSNDERRESAKRARSERRERQQSAQRARWAQ